VLCELCKQSGFNFIIAHCNFQLRGAESDRDEHYVRTLGEKYGVNVCVKKFDTEKFANENKISIQEAARKLRYGWFCELIQSKLKETSNLKPQTSNFLLTAHQADDNIETLLMNFLRGTGLHGLTGIPELNQRIRRPLLSFSKKELLAFAKENKLDFVEDSSNQSSDYTRNYFRNEIIPAIEKVYPQVKSNLQDNIERFKEIESLYKTAVGNIIDKICRKKGEEIHIPVKQLMAFRNKALIYEIISPYGFEEKQVGELIKLAESDSGKYIISPGEHYRIIKHRHWFIITPVNNTISENIIIESGIKEITYPEGKLQFETTPHSTLHTPHSEVLDLKHIRFPLLLRKWRTADYFYPLGMKKKKKKLARFFIDLKLSKADKEKVWVLESDQRIIWVVGYRIDERFKISESTEEVLKITFSTLTPS